MKLSNTMIMNETLLPNNKKAFTLAEVLITLSILGVVAALTIPSLVNRQSELAAIVRLKKAISQFEQVTEVYMAENDASDMEGMVRSGNNDAACSQLSSYFKVVTQTGGCTFTTADGVEWNFASDGSSVVVYDSATSPRYGVAMNANGGVANPATTDANAGTTAIAASDVATAKTNVYTAANFLAIAKPADVSNATVLKEKTTSQTP